MINRLSKEPKMLKLYGNIIANQEKRGFIEKVDVDINTNRRIHYIPHHAVKKDSLTTPIRIVYDCSCRESSDKASLNDCLMSVPPKINGLTGIIARFRLNKYAVSTDIEKALLQIELDENNQDVTRFLWLSDSNDPNSPLITYRFRVVLFGTTCSRFILNATVLRHLKLNPSHTSNLLKNDLYVDNVLSSFPDENSLISFYRESRSILSKGGFNLRSRTSNNIKLRQLTESEDCLEKGPTFKILGLRWDVESDKLSFRNNISFDIENTITKRDILSQSSSIFDPVSTRNTQPNHRPCQNCYADIMGRTI
jgi:hypothetical protein